MEFKIVISDTKTGKSVQRTVTEQNAKFFSGKKIGEKFKGESIDLQGYEFEISGGSDFAGFPMRKGIPGPVRKRILTGKGVGFNPHGKKSHRYKKGLRKRRTVCGDTIHEKITQVNLKIITQGTENLFEEKKEEPAEGEAPKEEAKK
ncbi:MAG: 30S ribosomal protein S6e [Nanoarchaeota archaeon]|nr:30S ribosomal protein S6e [Nanoarchaeota archaeon]